MSKNELGNGRWGKQGGHSRLNKYWIVEGYMFIENGNVSCMAARVRLCAEDGPEEVPGAKIWRPWMLYVKALGDEKIANPQSRQMTCPCL